MRRMSNAKGGKKGATPNRSNSFMMNDFNMDGQMAFPQGMPMDGQMMQVPMMVPVDPSMIQQGTQSAPAPPTQPPVQPPSKSQTPAPKIMSADATEFVPGGSWASSNTETPQQQPQQTQPPPPAQGQQMMPMVQMQDQNGNVVLQPVGQPVTVQAWPGQQPGFVDPNGNMVMMVPADQMMMQGGAPADDGKGGKNKKNKNFNNNQNFQQSPNSFNQPQFHMVQGGTQHLPLNNHMPNNRRASQMTNASGKAAPLTNQRRDSNKQNGSKTPNAQACYWCCYHLIPLPQSQF